MPPRPALSPALLLLERELRLIRLADSTDRSAWLRVRKEYLTASSAAAAVGESRWADFEDLVAEKSKPGHIGHSGNRPTWWGTIAEDLNVEAFRRLTGFVVVPNRTLWTRAAAEGVAATPDAFVLPPGASGRHKPEDPGGWVEWRYRGASCGHLEALRVLFDVGHAVLDAKNVRAKNQPLWLGDHPPKEYVWQAQAQMLATGCPVHFLVAKVDADLMVCHITEADEWMQTEISEAAAELQKRLRS